MRSRRFSTRWRRSDRADRPVPLPAIARASVSPRALVILGHPVSQSLSPVFQSAALEAVGLHVPYERHEVHAADLRSTLAALRRTRTGGNVTMPHKEAVAQCADRLTEVAARTGAVNTFWWEGDELVGHNTDVHGVQATIRALCAGGIRDDVVVLGAGGAAAAVLAGIEAHGGTGLAAPARVVVAARSRARAETLVRQMGSGATVADLADVDWDRVGLVVNATPAGMQEGDAPPVVVTLLAAHTAVYDLVYRRDGTAWVRAARARGLAAEDGLRMLVEQGAAAFECWFGIPAPLPVMWQALGVPQPPHDAPRP